MPNLRHGGLVTSCRDISFSLLGGKKKKKNNTWRLLETNQYMLSDRKDKEKVRECNQLESSVGFQADRLVWMH